MIKLRLECSEQEITIALAKLRQVWKVVTSSRHYPNGNGIFRCYVECRD